MDDEGSLPKSSVYKMISEGLPPGLRMGNDVKEMIVECCNEFIQTISSEANEISTKENKTTILPEHVVAALESLDFASMVETVKATMNDIKEEDKEVRAEKKKKKTYLGSVRVTDSSLGFNSGNSILKLPIGQSAFVGFKSKIVQTMRGLAVVTANPVAPNGSDLSGMSHVTDTDPAGVVLLLKQRWICDPITHQLQTLFTAPPTSAPTRNPTRSPTPSPTRSPTRNPTRAPTPAPVANSKYTVMYNTFASYRLDGWAFAQDCFHNTRTQYATDLTSNYNTGLMVRVGAVDHSDVNNMSGGFKKKFYQAKNGKLKITVRVQFENNGKMDRGENGYFLMRVGSQTSSPILTTYGRNPNQKIKYNMAYRSIEFGGINRGWHWIYMGCYVTRKTFKNEFVTLKIDNVKVENTPY